MSLLIYVWKSNLEMHKGTRAYMVKSFPNTTTLHIFNIYFISFKTFKNIFIDSYKNICVYWNFIWTKDITCLGRVNSGLICLLRIWRLPFKISFRSQSGLETKTHHKAPSGFQAKIYCDSWEWLVGHSSQHLVKAGRGVSKWEIKERLVLF